MTISSDASQKMAARHSGGSWATHFTAFFLGCLLTSFWPRDGCDCMTGAPRATIRKPMITSQTLNNPSSDCEIYLGTYHGSEYTSGQTVGQPKCLVESKFIKIQQHAVQFTPADEVIPDWIWIDYHDRINVLVQAPGKTDEFLIFEQTKYALEGRQSLAIVGGIIEPGEQPEEAARREVQEEMMQVCQEFHFLGRYRTDGK